MNLKTQNTEGVSPRFATLRHASLFTGIGGFDLAAERCGFENVFQCEIDEFCQKVLTKNFSNTAKYRDIKTFDASPYENKIDILTGGFPCQPFSQAGKQRGSADDRNLWHEMFRVIRQVKPRWIVAENVRGILTTEGGLVFQQACADLESEGYHIQPFLIPACAVNAPHQRERVWLVAHTNGGQYQRTQRSIVESPLCISEVNRTEYRTDGQSGGANETYSSRWENSKSDFENANGLRLEKHHDEQTATIGKKNHDVAHTNSCERQFLRGQIAEPRQTPFARTSDGVGQPQDFADPASVGELEGRRFAEQFDRQWYEVASELCRVDDGLPTELDKLRNSNRKDRLKALGNAIVPQVAFNIFQAILDAETD